MSDFTGFVAAASSEKTGTTVDYAAMDEYMLETCNLYEKETLVGCVSGLVDLGTQTPEDSKVEWNGTLEEEATIIKEYPNTYFEDMYDGKRYKRWPNKPVQCVGITIDFPDILVDKGQFFGDPQPPLPLRLLLNGEYVKKGGGKDISKLYPLNIRKNDSTYNKWSIVPAHTLYKMAVGAKLITPGQPFTPQEVHKLLGKYLQFEVQIFRNKGGYYTERIRFVGGVGRGQAISMVKTQIEEFFKRTATHTNTDVPETNNPTEVEPTKADVDVPQQSTYDEDDLPF